MPTGQRGHRTWHGTSAYVIRVGGALRDTWSDRLGGMRITPDDINPGCTLLEGTLPDQAALLGVLNGLYDLGMPLLSVECVDRDDV